MKVKNRRKRFFAIRSFRKDAHKKIFSRLDYMDFAIVDLVLHFNDGKRVHTGIFNQMGLDVKVSILTFIIGERHPKDMCQR